LPFACWPVYDPVLGPPCPEDWCLHDGGDEGWPAGVGADGRLRGLDPADTVAEYSDCQGRRRLAISNRVCLCVPRYVVLRKELRLEGVANVTLLGNQTGVLGQTVLLRRLLTLESHQNEQLAAARGPLRPGAVELFQGTTAVARVEGVRDLIRVNATLNVTGTCKEEKHPPGKPLLLHKWLRPEVARIGDVVTFYLRYTNPGDQPIADVAVSDSLISRLEYVPGSARSDREAVFTTQMNEAGSAILRWEIKGRLQPHQSGLLSFQARVR
jgi:uncharacterized repeat protein (TIGR01451 family)